MNLIGDGFKSLFRPSRRQEEAEKEEPKSPFAPWAQPLADSGKVNEGHLYLIKEVERWTRDHKGAVLTAATELPGVEQTVLANQIYRLSTQVDDGREVAQAMKLYQGVAGGQDRLDPKQRETVYLNMFRLHQKAEQGHSAYQAYVAGQGTAEERLLGDMATVNPAQRRWQNAEAVFSLFEIARTLPEDERKLFLSIYDVHGVFPNQDHANKVKTVWSHIARQPDKAAATADFLALRQEFADRHPSRGDNGCELSDPDCRTGFACRVLGEENEGLPIFTQMWRQENCDPFYVSEAMRVLRERVANGQAELKLEDALAVRRGLVASKDLAKNLTQDQLTWLTGQFSAQEFEHVSTALVKVGERSAPSLVRLVEELQTRTETAAPAEKRLLHARLHEVCAQAILFDGDADLSLNDIPGLQRGVTISENRVQIGQTSLKRRRS